MRLLVHLSDLHFGRVDPRVADALLGVVHQVKPHLVAVSGDFTQRARRRQFIRARRFLDALPRPQIVVPGNHDIPLFNLPVRLLNPLGGYRRHITDDLQPMHADPEILVLGTDTTRPARHKGGALHPHELRRLCDALSAAGPRAVKVIVGHHPFDDREAVEQLIVAGADVFLTGHLHVSYSGHTAERYAVAGRSAVVVEAGTATSTRMRGEANAFNLLRIDGEQLVVECYAWQPGPGTFTVGDVTRFSRTADGWK
jgi:3',5'-cyclic AMP phosphodiesterase CpdA